MKVGINGFGRIGKCIYKILIKKGIEVPLVNDPFITEEYLEYLIRYDTVGGRIECTREGSTVTVNGIKTELSKVMAQEEIPWEDHGVDYVVEATGLFTAMEECKKHRCKRIILTAASKDIPMFVYGVNHETLKDERVISGASCTTNCLAPLVKILHETFGIEEAFMSTVHAVTASQKVTDAKGSNWREARSANNIIPMTTGATTAITKIFPELDGKITGMCFRVPVQDVSVVDLTVRLKKKTSLADITKEIKKSKTPDVIGWTEDLVVSSDMINDSRSSIVDIKACIELNSRFFKLISWYDNEYGYSCRVVDLLRCMDK